MKGEVLMSMWTVYDHPTDYPDNFVARRFEIVPGELEPRRTGHVIITETVEELNEHFDSLGLAFLARHEQDEPQIMGVWM